MPWTEEEKNKAREAMRNATAQKVQTDTQDDANTSWDAFNKIKVEKEAKKRLAEDAKKQEEEKKTPFTALNSQLKSIQQKNSEGGFLGGVANAIGSAVKSLGDTATRAFVQNNPITRTLSQAGVLPEKVTLPEKLRNPLNPSGEISLGYSKDTKTAVGQGAQDLVNALPGVAEVPGAVSKMVGPLKAAAPKTFGTVSGALTASGYGALQGAATELQKEDYTAKSIIGSAYDVAKNPLVWGTGGLLGFVGGKLSPQNKAIQQKKVDAAVDDLENTYYKLSTTKSLKAKLDKADVATQKKNLSGTTGTNPARTLAEEGIVPEQSGGRLNTRQQAQQLREKLTPFHEIQKDVLAEMDTQAGRAGGSGGVSLIELEKQALQRAKTAQNVDSGKYTGIAKELQKEFQDLRDIYGDTVSYSKLGDIKSSRWNGVKFDANRPLISDANYVIAKEAQQTIQNEAERLGNDTVAQLNRYTGDRLEAAKYLEQLDGSVVKGGRLQKYVFQTIGSTMGSNPLSKILGAMGGDAVSNILLSNQVSPLLKRKVLSQIQAKSPEVYQQAVDWLVKNKINPEFPIALPEGRPGPVNTGVIAPPAPTTFEAPASKIGTTDLGVRESMIQKISEQYNISKSLTAKIVESALKELK